MATPSVLPVLLLVILSTLASASASSFNITEILSKHPKFSTFNNYLTKTHLASKINRFDAITILALDNPAMSKLISKKLSLVTLHNVLSLHVLLNYYDTKKLHKITHDTAATMSASKFDFKDYSGYVNITRFHGRKVGFSSADTFDDKLHYSYFVKSLVEMPYYISVIQISQVIDSAQAEALAIEPSTVSLTTLLAAKGCKDFAGLLHSSGAEKTFQDNVISGLTVFCVGDNIVKTFMPRYKKLTTSKKMALLLYHGVPIYSSMSMLRSNNGIMNTLATDGANQYDFTVKNYGVLLTIKTKVVTAKVTKTLLDREPLAIFMVDKFLLPPELFKLSN